MLCLCCRESAQVIYSASDGAGGRTRPAVHGGTANPAMMVLMTADGDPEPDVDTSSEPEAADRDVTGGFDRWRKESALGAVGTGVARGLQAVFAPHVDEIVVVASVPGEPPDADQRLQVILDPDDPTKSIAIMPTVTDPPSE